MTDVNQVIDAATFAGTLLPKAIRLIDSDTEPGFALKNPAVLAAFMQAAATVHLASQLREGLTELSGAVTEHGLDDLAG